MVTIDRSMNGVKRLLEFMVNRELLEYQLSRACDTVLPTLREQFSWLRDAVAPNTDDLSEDATRDTMQAWLAELTAEHGAVHRVTRLPRGIWEDKDPVAELREMAPHATIIAAMPTGYSWETFTNPAPGLFRNPPLEED